jgi:hypothetical protein
MRPVTINPYLVGIATVLACALVRRLLAGVLEDEAVYLLFLVRASSISPAPNRRTARLRREHRAGNASDPDMTTHTQRSSPSCGYRASGRWPR